MIRKQQVSAGAQRFQLVDAVFRAFYFHVNGLGAGRNGGVQDPKLLLDAPVEAAFILMTRAGSKNRAVRVPRQKAADRSHSYFRRRQVIQPVSMPDGWNLDLLGGNVNLMVSNPTSVVPGISEVLCVV